MRASCPGNISNQGVEKRLTYKSSVTRTLAPAPGFRFLAGPFGEHFRSVTSLTSTGTQKIVAFCVTSQGPSIPPARKNFTQRLGSNDPWRRQTNLQGARFISDS